MASYMPPEPENSIQIDNYVSKYKTPLSKEDLLREAARHPKSETEEDSLSR